MDETVSLKEYVERRFTDGDKAISAALVAQEKAIQAALVAQEKAIIKAESAAERRFELLNELRQDVATKGEIDALEKIVAAQDQATKARHDALAKLVYIGLGAVLALQFVSQFLK